MIRKIHIDVLKGILIILVVIGHLPFPQSCHDVIYWFHIPAFFWVSGYLYKPKTMDRLYVLTVLRKYMLPCLSYSILGFLIFYPESVVKYVARIIYGGALNTTSYTYPYWFIYSLFIVVVTYNALSQYLSDWYKMISIVSIYVIVHVLSGYWNDINMLPWAIGQSAIVLLYYHIGDLCKKMNDKATIGYVSIALCVCFTVFCLCFEHPFELNIKGMYCSDLLLDIVVPVTFTISLYYCSLLISKMKYIDFLFSYIGKASMTIMFTHAAVIYMTANMMIECKFIVSILLGLLMHYLFGLSSVTMFLFNGNKVNNI